MLGKLLGCEADDQKITLKYEKRNAFIEVLTDSIIRFFVPFQSENTVSKAIEGDKKQPSKVYVEKNEDHYTINTDSLCIKVFDDFKVDIYDVQGKLLCADYRGGRVIPETISKKSMELLAAEGHVIDNNAQEYHVQVIKQIQGDESFYGLGDKTGFLNKREYEYEMWNTDNPDPHVDSFKTLYKSIPFFVTLRADAVYGIFFDNTFRSYFNMGKENTNYYFFGASGGNLDYYFFAGDSMAEIIGEYTYLTGRTPMPQRWTLGYHQSRWGYESAEQVMEIAKHFREYQIPCDTIHLDIDYMQKFKVFTWDDKEYGRPGELAKTLEKMGFKIVTIIDPGVKVETGYSVYEEGVENDYFVRAADGEIYENVVWPGVTAFPDFGRKEVRDWWAGNVKKLLDAGVRGVWNDMNEPASFRGEFPDDVVFSDEERKANHLEMHNVYGHFMGKATYEGLKKYDGRRPFVITRACYAGTQKYSTVWTGDNNSIWAHVQMAIPQLCNLGLSGVTYAGTDIGGFGADTTPELMSRWIEMACFSPLCRNHAAKGTRNQEPWRLGEQTQKIYKKYVELRYRMLPYLYDCFWQAENTGLPVLRPLVLHYEKDAEVRNCNDEFLVGEHILMAPVVEQGQTRRMVYLPKGNWVDYWTKEKLAGGQYCIRKAPIDVCPIFIKEGSVLPNVKLAQNTDEIDWNTLLLDVYDGEGTYVHYQDNGSDFAYCDGEYNLYEITNKAGDVTVKLTHHGYELVYKNIQILGTGKTVSILEG